MVHALDQARQAAANGEVPVGAVVFDPALAAGDGVLAPETVAGPETGPNDGPESGIIARAGNCPITTHDPTGHAEIVALRRACAVKGNYRLPGLWLAVTLEPCVMCAGAISHARIERVIYGASDPKGGALAHGPRVFDQPTTHWRPAVTGGVRAQECADLLRGFFKERRS